MCVCVCVCRNVHVSLCANNCHWKRFFINCLNVHIFGFWFGKWKVCCLLCCFRELIGSVWTSICFLNSSFVNWNLEQINFFPFLSILLLPLLFLQFLKVYHLCFEILHKPSEKCSKSFMKSLNYPPSVFLDFHKLPLIKEEW